MAEVNLGEIWHTFRSRYWSRVWLEGGLSH